MTNIDLLVIPYFTSFILFQSNQQVNSESSDEEKDRPKVKSSRRRGLAARLAKKENFQPDQVSEDSAVYSTRVSKMFSSAIQNVPVAVQADQPNSGNYFLTYLLDEKLQIKTCVELLQELDVILYEEEDDPLQGRLKESKKSNVKVTSPAEITVIPNIIQVDDEEEILLTPPTKLSKIGVASPSPPPPPPPPSDTTAIAPRRNPRLNKGVKNAMKSLSDAKLYMTVQDINNRAREDRQESDIVCLDDEDDGKITVRIKVFGLKVYRFKMYKYESIQNVLKDIAAKENVDENCLLLVHNERTIRPSDSPESLDLHVADIIECHESTGEVCDLSTLDDSYSDDGDDITIMVQSRQSKKKMEFKISKNAPLTSLITQYSVKMGVNASKIRLQFDGEDITQGDTAKHLDIEDGYCIDAIY
ncbi:hypothetical protein FSP39_008003 [Pinctada imbricata]|uniref:Ubiquitin-like domain-containing protein n=1 Tax=Pinctada imbricata TaxID=66713 RepID=A0AA88XN03_PINIB|nr:hypothetical protein FSP39_008003 [Pinctada imbricata]